MKKIFYIAVFCSIAVSNLNALLVTGDPNAATGETFSFDIGFAGFDTGAEYSSPRLWTAAGSIPSTDAAKPYGLSFTNQFVSYVGSSVFPEATPMTNEEAATVFTYNGTTAAVTLVDPNPIWGKKFHLFNVPSQTPIFVLDDSKNKVYSVLDIQRYATPTTDKPNVTQLLEHDFGVGETTHAIQGYGKEVIFAAHATGAFGSTTSKITELLRSTFVVSSVTDAQGNVTSEVTLPYFKTIADTEISISTDALKGGSSGNNLVALGSSVALAYTLNNLFIGVDALANAAAGSCATALTFAILNATSDGFLFKEVAPASLLTTGAPTVISVGAGNEIRITNITGMVTSTALQYLIVARDGGTGPQTIYALPIVSWGTDTGKIADFSKITNVFDSRGGSMTARYFTTEVSSFADIDPSGVYAAQLLVGGALPLGAGNSIKQLYAVGDSVYAVIGDAYGAGQTPGTFRSQPIYAQDGHIVSWTAWQRVLGSDQQMNYSFVDQKTLSGYYIGHVTTNFRAINQTTFVSDSNLEPLLLQSALGGVQGMFNFPSTTPGFNNSISLLISTVYGAVYVGQTGVVDTYFKILQPMTSANVVSYSGEALNNSKAIIAAELAHNGSNHWLFVAGASGVSVLTDDSNGYTWTGNLASVVGLNAGQTFKTVGDFSFVKKLVWDSTYLYVLTSNELYRISLDPNKFKAIPTAALNPELILSSSGVGKNATYFLDIIIDSGFCVLGTTNGLYTFGGNQPFTEITIPSGLPAVSQLIAFSSAAEPQRSFKTLGNILVLNNTFGTQQARINRFTITDSVMVPFNDYLMAQTTSEIVGIPSSFIKFDNYINNYFTDGSWNIASSYYLGPNQVGSRPTPSALQLYAGIRTGYSSSRLIIPSLSAYAPLSFIFAPNLAGFIRESTSGSLISYGSFQTHANV